MSKALNINTAIMFLISLLVSYIVASLMAVNDQSSAYGWGFIFGRATMGVLLPFLIVFIPASLVRLKKPKFTKGTIIIWWVVFVLITGLAGIGSLLPPADN